jgi:hypothetical protein
MGEKYRSRSVIPADGKVRRYQDSCYALGPEYIAALDRASAPWKPKSPEICYVCGKYLQKSAIVRRGAEVWGELTCGCPGRLVLVRLKEAPPPPRPPNVDVKVSVARADGVKCPRCWNYHTVQGNPMEVCDRCVAAVTEMLPGLVAEGKWTQADADEWQAMVKAMVDRWRA